ncbi:MAG TPA: hypothetical protein VK439_14905, partial [Rubrivivax sp.]|nr:hypothetical protein [Rubrivivax sp.]
MNLHFLRRLLPLLLCATATLPTAVLAGTQTDIDIYSGSSAVIDRPNVLLILDSSANWSTNIPGVANCRYKDNGVDRSDGPVDQGTKLAIEQCALHNVIDGLPVDTSKATNDDARFNVAIMLMNESPNSGGYPRQAFVPVTTENKAILKALIRALSRNGDKGSNADYGQAMYEAYLYYKGLAPLNGTLGSKYDSAAFSAGRYRSPATGSCGRNYIIVIGNGSPQNSSPENAVQGLMSTRIDVDLATLSVAERDQLKAKIANAALGNDEKSWSDELSRFMSRLDVSGMEGVQGITTHAVAVKKGASDGEFPALMASIASASGGLFYEATTAEVLIESINKIFNQIQAVNSVFASASLPVSVNARGTYLNQVYMGMFRPDADGHPRWRGNLKQYRFALDGINNLYLADEAGG